MGGVGSFSRVNRTLYVGRIKETGPGPETEEIVIRHFKEWGQIEKSASYFVLTDSFSKSYHYFGSSSSAISLRRFRHLRLRALRPVREGGYGVPIVRQRRDP